MHFDEELIAVFHRELPALVGDKWAASQLIVFNVTWFLIFVAGGVAWRSGKQIGSLVVLFFALGGGLLNGVGHIVLALVLGRYFPGLYTAPLMLAIGVAILKAFYSPPSASTA